MRCCGFMNFMNFMTEVISKLYDLFYELYDLFYELYDMTFMTSCPHR